MNKDFLRILLADDSNSACTLLKVTSYNTNIGATPYPGITPQRLYNLLKAGYRMTKPENCSDDLYYLMRLCWRAFPRERPSFKELVVKLDCMLQDTVGYMDFSLKCKRGRRRSREMAPPPNDLKHRYGRKKNMQERTNDDLRESLNVTDVQLYRKLMQILMPSTSITVRTLSIWAIGAEGPFVYPC
ncbi:fibroblast growth factor receptor 3 [Trichonephila clavipes]|nr:fibroblast growth factor receptor 3 [Trichonephila clavipes]